MMLALAALKNWHISALDVKTAFLYGELDEELYMEQPEGFKVKGQEGKVSCSRLGARWSDVDVTKSLKAG
jgi:hypothetical protein